MKNLFGAVMIASCVFVLAGCQNKKVEAPTSFSLQSVYFDFDRAVIRQDGVAAMQGNAGYLKQNPNVSVVIEGNCDNRGTNEYNMALGHRRAEAGKNYLANLGVNANNMRTVSFGEERPVCNENNESCWQRNRRDDFRR